VRSYASVMHFIPAISYGMGKSVSQHGNKVRGVLNSHSTVQLHTSRPSRIIKTQTH
jgi:hypothetical protein